MKSRYTKLIAIAIVFGLPFAFFFYYNNKVKELPLKDDEIKSYWPTPFFQYENQQGDMLSSDDLKGFIYVVDFIFTNCGSICPDLSKALSEVQMNFKDDPRVKLVSFTIDPIRDSIPVLRDYALRYGAVKDKWYFLCGDTSSVWKMASEGFKVPVVYTPEGGAGNEFTHTDKIVLVDSEGMIRGFYSGTDREDLDTLYNTMVSLLVALRK